MQKIQEENEELKYQIDKLLRRQDRRDRIGTELIKIKKQNKKLEEENIKLLEFYKFSPPASRIEFDREWPSIAITLKTL